MYVWLTAGIFLLIISLTSVSMATYLFFKCKSLEKQNKPVLLDAEILKQRKIALDILSEDLEREMDKLILLEKYEQCDGLNKAIEKIGALIRTLDNAINNSPDKFK